MTDQLDPPKDGTMVCLLVDYSGDGGAPLEDALTAWTIGYNTLADTGEDEWIMVGWDWCHDCYCQGSGKIIGWAPFAPTMTTPDTAAIRGRYCGLPNVGVVVDAAAVDRDIAALCDELERMRAEADGLPGTIIDRFGDAAMIQSNAAWAERMVGDIADALREVTGVSTVILNGQGRAALALKKE